MPTEQKHLQIINQNFKTILHLINPAPEEYLDWCTTIIYYMALHYIHAYFSLKGYHPSDHQNTQRVINDDPNLKSLYDMYRNLENDSRDARYEGFRTNIYNLRNESLKWFDKIQDEVYKLLKNKTHQKIDLYPHFPSN